MTTPKIIAICGAKRSGKDYIANFLSINHGYTHIKISKKLKDVCQILFDFTDDQVENDIKDVVDPRWEKSPRSCMQFIGTEIMQYKLQEFLPNQGRKFWINSLLCSIDENKRYVISDLRFLHEFEELRKKDCYIIKVEREQRVREDDMHQSEQEFKDIIPNLTVYNDMSTNKILTQIQSCVDRL